MGYTLSNACLELAKVLGGVRIGEATVESANTLVDTKRLESSEYWSDGVLWVLSGTDIGKMFGITSFGDGTFTIDGSLTIPTPPPEDPEVVKYACSPPRFTKEILIVSINKALFDLGGIVQTDTSLTVTENTLEYTLPDSVYNVKKVFVAGIDDEPYNFEENFYWSEINGKLVFDVGKQPMSAGKKIKLIYVAPHADLLVYNSEVNSAVDMRWLIWASAVYAYRDIISRVGKDKPELVELMNEAIRKEEEARTVALSRIHRTISRAPHLGVW